MTRETGRPAFWLRGLPFLQATPPGSVEQLAPRAALRPGPQEVVVLAGGTWEISLDGGRSSLCGAVSLSRDPWSSAAVELRAVTAAVIVRVGEGDLRASIDARSWPAWAAASADVDRGRREAYHCGSCEDRLAALLADWGHLGRHLSQTLAARVIGVRREYVNATLRGRPQRGS